MLHVIIIWWTFKHDQSMIQIQVHVTLKRLSNPWFVTWVRHSCQKLFLWHKNMSLWTYSNWYLPAQWRIQHLRQQLKFNKNVIYIPVHETCELFRFLVLNCPIQSSKVHLRLKKSEKVACLVNSTVFFSYEPLKISVELRKVNLGCNQVYPNRFQVCFRKLLRA